MLALATGTGQVAVMPVKTVKEKTCMQQHINLYPEDEWRMLGSFYRMSISLKCVRDTNMYHLQIG